MNVTASIQSDAIRELSCEEMASVSGAATREARFMGFTFQAGDNGWAIWIKGGGEPMIWGEWQ